MVRVGRPPSEVDKVGLHGPLWQPAIIRSYVFYYGMFTNYDTKRKWLNEMKLWAETNVSMKLRREP